MKGIRRLKRFWTVPLEPLACTVKVSLVKPVGVPAMVPVEELSDKPPGSPPLVTDQVQPVPHPAAARVCEYATPIVPCGRTPLVAIANGSTLMV